MDISRYHRDSLETLSNIYLESRALAFTWLDPSSFSVLDFEKDTQGELILMAVSNEKIVGFISVWEPDNFIHHLYVSPEWHNQGAGSQLLEAVKSRGGNLSLKCMAANKAALAFYEYKGFVIASKGSDSLGDYYLMTFNAHT